MLTSLILVNSDLYNIYSITNHEEIAAAICSCDQGDQHAPILLSLIDNSNQDELVIIIMALSLNCKEAGDPVCTQTMYGETEEEILANIKKHGIEVHGYTSG